MSKMTHTLRLYSEEELLQIIKDSLRYWATEEFDANPESNVTFQSRVEENTEFLIDRINDL